MRLPLPIVTPTKSSCDSNQSNRPLRSRSRFGFSNTLLFFSVLIGAGICSAVIYGDATSATTQAVATAKTAPTPILMDAEKRFAQDTKEVPDFQRHVLPLMSRAGCNGRACHGSFQGQGGFRLSLFGYDFDADHKSLLDEDTGRVDRDDAEQSLILLKPTLTEDHEGGERFKVDSWQYRLLKRWIESGAKKPASDAAHFVKLEVIPNEIVFDAPGKKLQLKVISHWSDGTREDVTPLSRFRTNDESIAVVDASGSITSKGVGDSHVVAFYDNGVAPVQVIVPVSKLVGEKYPKVAMPTQIDKLVVAKLRKLGIVPSELSTDATFLRRVSLDMTGTLPAPAEIEAFMADRAPDKRAKKIEELLERPAYSAWWTTKLCDWTGNSDQNVGEQQLRREQTVQWYEWIHRRVRENMPYDKIVGGIVMAAGRRPNQNYQAFCEEMGSYYRTDNPKDFSERDTMPHFWSRRNVRDAKDKALSFSYAFLGVRLQCAQCHKHPFDQWTKQDFDQFTAFFQPITYGVKPDIRQEYNQMQKALVKNQKGGQARKKIAQMIRDGKTVPWRELYIRRDRKGEPITQAGKKKRKKKRQKSIGRVITPKLLGGEQVIWQQHDSPPAALMEWMTSKENPYFAKAFVNRVWATYFNVGIVSPADDFNLANPPSNEPLLDYLADGFIDSGYDMKWLHREIANSRTYQLSWKVNDTNQMDERNFSRSVPRRMAAEATFDAVNHVTASNELAKFLRANIQTRAIGPTSGLVRNNRNQYALVVFGKPQRLTNCDCERSTEPSLLQTIFLRNDQQVLTLIDRRDGWISKAAADLGEPFRPAASGNKGKGRKQNGKFKKRLAQLQTKARLLRKAGNKKQAKIIEKRIAQLRKIQSSTVPLKKSPKKKPAAKSDGGSPNAKSKPPKPADVKPVVLESKGQVIDRLIRDAYLRTFSRPPTDEEHKRVRKHLASTPSLTAGMRDILWVLINSKEFIVNH